MRIPFFSKKKKANETDEILLALDVGTRFIKAVIFKRDGLNVKVLGYAKTPQQSNSMHSAMIVNLQNVISSTDICIGRALSAADKIAGTDLGLPDKVILGIAGELVKGVTIVADYDREKPNKKIEQKEIDDVMAQVKDQMFDQVKADMSEELGLNEAQIEEISTSLVATYLDNVKLDNPIGFTGSKAEYSIYTTFSPSLHLNSLKELADKLGLEILEVVVEPYAIARSVKGSHDQAFSGIFIDVGGGTTDIAVVKNGAVMGTKMFAFGGDVFTKRIATDFKVELEEAEKMKLDYSNQKLSQKQAKAVQDSIQKDISVWTEGVEISLAEFEEIDTFPTQMYFSGGGSILPDIRRGLMSHPWLQVLPFAKFPKMEYLFPNQLEGIDDQTRTLIDQSDIAPAALALMIRN
ncbi:pilus assembly protein PilM [Candidatus Dojkabacteria bacterium]|nr:pilus assembly protein PilM [Candidatus Dojkabacteria bacterium]